MFQVTVYLGDQPRELEKVCCARAGAWSPLQTPSSLARWREVLLWCWLIPSVVPSVTERGTDISVTTVDAPTCYIRPVLFWALCGSAARSTLNVTVSSLATPHLIPGDFLCSEVCFPWCYSICSSAFWLVSLWQCYLFAYPLIITTCFMLEVNFFYTVYSWVIASEPILTMPDTTGVLSPFMLRR